MKIGCVVGTRPNFIKAIPVYEQLKKDFSVDLIHTGQHYDEKLSRFILDELGAKEPDYLFKDETFPTKSFSAQYGAIMDFMDGLISKNSYDWLFVFGDVTSTLIAAQIAKYRHKKVAHVESGLRSFDLLMPEELNRMMVDKISDLLFVTEDSGVDNLKNEGVDPQKICHVGNTMIDTLFKFKKRITSQENLNQTPYSYYVLTLHRPSNVDDKKILEKNIELICAACGENEVLFPVHPRTKKNLNEKLPKNLRLVEPLVYTKFLQLVNFSKAVLTDSGGIQEEASVLNVPCFTLRENTERPSTIRFGSNQLVSFENLDRELKKVSPVTSRAMNASIPLWDGRASERILDVFKNKI